MAESRLGRVLVVDDEHDIRSMLAIVLSVEGWSVVEASGGTEALELCADTEFDVVVLDQRMPGITGVEVARQLAADGFPGRLVLFSAYVDGAVEGECQELGVTVVDKVDWYALVDACGCAPSAALVTR